MGDIHNQQFNNSPPVSPTRPDRPATGAELAAVLLDQRRVAAFLAVLAGQCLGSGGLAFFLRHIHHAHVLYREAVLVEDAEHRVAVDDQLGDVGYRRGVAFHLDTAGHACHEIA